MRVLHDPWFTEGIYDGSWFHFPVVTDPVRSIGDVDMVYISHVHPDHYDPDFLKKYFEIYGRKEILIADHQPNHLASKMRADGFKPAILREPLKVGTTTIKIIPHRTGSISDIDSAVIIRYFDGVREHMIANANDVIFDDPMIALMKEHAYQPDILLCGYTGAGPYPQTYFDITDHRLQQEAERKKHAFFARYKSLVSALQPKKSIPFAGKYVLGGKLSHLNPHRGVADPVEILGFDQNAIVLADAGGEISTSDLRPSDVRVEAYKKEDISRRIQDISNYSLDYERLIPESEIHQLPLKRLLAAAAKRAHEKSECEQDYYFIIRLLDEDFAIINARRHADPIVEFRKENNGIHTLEPRSEINIDPRYLFGLLTSVYHWNNAEVGSQYQTRRYPNELNKGAQSFLNYLAI